jgi:acetyl-CoA carboxylase beta subunit
MDKDESNVGNCPHCTKIIFRDAVFNSEAVFVTRCPHCQKPVKVCIRKRVEIILLPLDDRKEKYNTGITKLTIIVFVLYLPALSTLSNCLDLFDGLI